MLSKFNTKKLCVIISCVSRFETVVFGVFFYWDLIKPAAYYCPKSVLYLYCSVLLCLQQHNLTQQTGRTAKESTLEQYRGNTVPNNTDNTESKAPVPATVGIGGPTNKAHCLLIRRMRGRYTKITREMSATALIGVGGSASEIWTTAHARCIVCK